MTRALLQLIPIFFGLLFCVACESPKDQLDRVLDEAAACEGADPCVIAGATDCSCGAPVNAEQLQDVKRAAAAVSCCDPFGGCVAVDCAAQLDPRCEDNRCVADVQ